MRLGKHPACSAHLSESSFSNVPIFRECLNECLLISDEIEWPEACVARTKYQLGMILLNSKTEAKHANDLIEAARKILTKLDHDHKLMQKDSWLKHGPDFEAAVFDHVVSFEAGRYLVGQLLPFPLQLDDGANIDRQSNCVV